MLSYIFRRVVNDRMKQKRTMIILPTKHKKTMNINYLNFMLVTSISFNILSILNI